jgi:hypothetical protein
MDQREASKNRKRKNKQSLVFVGHSSEGDKAFPHKPYPNGQRTSCLDNNMDSAQHHKRTSLTAFLEKPSTHSNTSGSQFKSVVTANTTSSAVVQTMLQGWTATANKNKNNNTAQESFSSFQNNENHQEEEWNDDDFLQELEMSYSRMNSLL